MKCAKEVMEKWELATNVRYTKELFELVETITEQLYVQASAGQDVFPKVSWKVRPIKNGRVGVALFIGMKDGKKYTCSVFQEDFLIAMKALCYRVKQTSYRDPYSNEDYYEFDISPNPSC